MSPATKQRQAVSPGPAEAIALRSALASLSRLAAPIEIDRAAAATGDIPPARASGVLRFHFCFREVPFEARTERCQGRPVLSLTGDLGILPFTVENPVRRRRLRKALDAARRHSRLRWEITARHRIHVIGEIDLGAALTPTAVIAGAATLLLQGRPYLDLLVDVAGE
jgi:hypothetical protein